MFDCCKQAKSGNPSLLGLLVFVANVLYFTNVSANEVKTLSKTNTVQTHRILITNFSFKPENLTVKIGDKIIWINKDFAPHNITKSKNLNKNDNSVEKLLSPNLMEKEKFTLVVKEELNYFCGLHPSMKGTIKIDP